MSMSMHAGYNETIIFSDWTTDEPAAFAVSCVVLFFIGVALEAVKCMKERFSRRIRKSHQLLNESDVDDSSRETANRFDSNTYLK